MKKCSTCGREYDKSDLNFCPEDGGVLNAVAGNSPDILPPTVFSIGAGQFNAPSAPQTPPSTPFNPPNNFGNAGGNYNNQPPPGNAQSNFNQQPPPPNFGGTPGNQGGNFGGNQAFNSSFNTPPPAQKSKLPLILGGLALLVVLGGGAVLAIAAFIFLGSKKDENTDINVTTKEGQVKARLVDLFGNCQKQNYSAAADFFYNRGVPAKAEEVERSCRPIKNSLDTGNGYEFGNFLTQGAGDKEVNAWEVYFKKGAEKIGQIFAFQMIDGKYRLVDIDPISNKAPVVSNTNSSSNTAAPSNTNRRPEESSTGRTFDSLRQQQLGAFRLGKIEKTNYMKMYPNLEEESLTYTNSAGKKVFVNKTRFPSSAEALRVVKDMIQSAKNGGATFTETVPCYSNDGREVGVTSTRTADKGGAKNYTVYYSHDNVVTFIFSLENDKAAVDEVFKNGDY